MPDEMLRMSIQTLVRYPGRSALTALGLAIGVGAFIAMVSFGQGARGAVLAQFESLGTSVLNVRTRVAAKDALSRPAQALSAADVTALRREATTVSEIGPVASRRVDLSVGGEVHRATLRGTTTEHAALHRYTLAAGGMFGELDQKGAGKLCVLGATPAAALFGQAEPLGRRLLIAGALPCRVIGVFAAKGRSIGGGDLDNFVLLPLRSYELYLGLPDGYSSIDLRPHSPALLESARAEATEILRRAHRLGAADPADFDVVSPDDVTRAADRTSSILAALLAAIAAVSLVVGGIGIMNIQLVAVAERTREIGIRAAIGASPGQISRQFVAEGCLLSAVGAGVGMVLGLVTANVVADAMQWPRAVSPRAMWGSGLFGFAVGVLFGFLPASRAARLDPIVALRRE